MPIFVGVRWRGIKIMSSKIIAILLLAVAISFEFSYFYETNIIMSDYVVPQWLFIDIETDDLE